AAEFPAVSCGLPSNSVVVLSGVPYSPLAAGLSTGTAALPGQSPLKPCFDNNGIVIDTDSDELPTCWETNQGGSGPAIGAGIDFHGNGARDATLCAQANINGDATIPATATTGCADRTPKALGVDVGWWENPSPDPQALNQTATTVAVQSVTAAFAAAPVTNPDTTNGIRLHIQVDKQPV